MAREEPAELSLSRLFDLALDMLCVAGTDGYFKRINPAFGRTLGYRDDELLGRPFLDFVHPQDVDSTLGAVASLADGQVVTDFENRYRASDGSWRWLVWRSMPSDDGRLIYACARDITAEKDALADAGAKADLAARQGRDLERLGTAHRVMTRAVADGATAADVVRSVAALTGKPTALCGVALQLVEAAGPDGARYGPWSLDRAGIQVRRLLKELSPTQLSVVLPPFPERGIAARHLVARVAARGEHFGYLSVAEVGSPLSWFDAQVVEHSSTVLSLELLSSRRQQDAARQAREDFVADLLQGDRDAIRLRQRASTYGVDLDRAHVLVRVAWDPAASHHITGAARRDHLARHLQRHLGGVEVVAVGVPGADVLLCPIDASARTGPERVRVATQRALRSARLADRIRGAVVSGLCTDVAHYADAHRELRAVFGALEATPMAAARVALASELGLLRILISNGTVASARRFATELLGPLTDPDGSDLLDTLRAFLAANARYRETARALGVHENTVRHRLGRIRRLTRIDPADLGSLLDARFALQTLDMMGPPPPATLLETSTTNRDSRPWRTPHPA
jgi:PAS domain S-box-containing protein